MKSIRVAIILSLILVMILTYLFLQIREQGLKMRSDDPRVWDSVIAEFEAQDASEPPSANALLLIGDAGIRLWDSVADDMQPFNVVARGFGGAKIIDLSYYVNRIVSPYQPKAIVVYIGSNDFTAAYGNTPKSLEQAKPLYLQLVDRLEEAAPDAAIFIVALKPSTHFWALWPEFTVVNQYLQQLAAGREGVFFIDANAGLFTEQAEPNPDLLLFDGMHNNDEGYAVWGAAIKSVVLEAIKYPLSKKNG
ncbi:GDSL-type esterase/lipase family protein [Oceanicoccus sagamiensis]|nr:GDSL-type esterase/lipase family protein [Oceanicoccus sagamiensis]